MNRSLVTTVDLLRHGTPQGGIRYRGSLDDPLSELGWQQMRSAVAGQRPWDIIISSPLRRCAEFARELSDRLGLRLEIDPGWREISFGAWEGHTPAAIEAADPQAWRRFWSDPENCCPPDGESLTAFAARIREVWQALLTRYAGRHVLVISHGGVIRMVLCQALEMPLRRLWRLEVPYAACSRLRVYGGGGEVEPLLVFHGKDLE